MPGKAAAVYKVIPLLALLDEGEYTDVVAELKRKIPQLNIKNLNGKVSKARRQQYPEKRRDYPVLRVNDRQPREMVSDALRILEEANNPPVIFLRSGELVRLVIDENNNARIQPMSEARVRAHLEQMCDFITSTQDGDKKDKAQPRAIAESIMSQPGYRFPALSAITNCPPVRSDGNMFVTEGYDPLSQLYYHQKTPCRIPRVPVTPTEADIKAAKNLLEEVVCDFPFDSQASKANAIALLMTPVIRGAFDGVPMGALINAPKQKSGKGLLSQVAAIIATGGEYPVTAPPVQDSEWNKLIGSILLEGPSMLIFDNIKHVLGGSALEAALTAKEATYRVLGLSKMMTLPNKAIWIFNGNNVKTTDDMVTRVFMIRIDPECSNPEDRSDFKHPRLKQWVIDNRGRIISAIVTLYRGWIAAGKPEARSIPTVGSYEDYAMTIGGTLEFAGIEGFLGNRKDARAEISTEAPQWETFFDMWQGIWNDNPVTTNDFMERYNAGEFDGALPTDLASAIDNATSPQAKSVNAGRIFSQRANTRFGDLDRHIYADRKRKGAVIWRLGDNAHKRENYNATASDRLIRETSVAYECAKCHKPVVLVESRLLGVTGEYSCSCGHKGRVDKPTYENWVERQELLSSENLFGS